MGFYHLPVCGSLQLTPRAGTNPAVCPCAQPVPSFNSRPSVGAKQAEIEQMTHECVFNSRPVWGRTQKSCPGVYPRCASTPAPVWGRPPEEDTRIAMYRASTHAPRGCEP